VKFRIYRDPLHSQSPFSTTSLSMTAIFQKIVFTRYQSIQARPTFFCLHSNSRDELRKTFIIQWRVHNGRSRSSKVIDFSTNGKARMQLQGRNQQIITFPYPLSFNTLARGELFTLFHLPDLTKTRVLELFVSKDLLSFWHSIYKCVTDGQTDISKMAIQRLLWQRAVKKSISAKIQSPWGVALTVSGESKFWVWSERMNWSYGWWHNAEHENDEMASDKWGECEGDWWGRR